MIGYKAWRNFRESPECEVRRISIPRTRVNKAKKKGLSCYAPALLVSKTPYCSRRNLARSDLLWYLRAHPTGRLQILLIGVREDELLIPSNRVGTLVDVPGESRPNAHGQHHHHQGHHTQ